MKSIARIIGFVLLGLITVALGIWSVLAVAYAGPGNDWVRAGLAVSYAAAFTIALTALYRRRSRWYGLAIYTVLSVTTLLWFINIAPSNSLDWQADVATLASATIDGDMVTVHNIRNFDYRSEFDYSPRYYDKSFDLRELTGVDVVAVYWMGPAIAHVFLSFSFGRDDHLAVSIETRKEVGEEYSTLKGFFRRYELYYVVADERDVIRLRTNYRQNPVEDVYVYRAKGDRESGRRLFLEYIRRINSLNAHPEFYNTLTTNCTTSIWLNTRVNDSHLPLDWRVLVSGYLPRFLYDSDRLETDGLSFDDLQRSVHVNERAIVTGDAADFSQRIRARAL